MTSSRRPPSRRDPRAEEGAAPPADDLGALRRASRAGSRVPSRPPSSRPGPSEQDFEALRSRYAEAESKRRRAEALADGLAQRVAQLEGEVREGRRPTPAPGGDEARRRLEAKVAELEQGLTTQASMLAAAQAKLQVTEGMLSASETANAELDEKAARARARADAAEDELARFEQRLANGELIGTEAAQDNEARYLELEGQLAAARTKLEDVDARHEARHASLSAEASAKVTALEARIAVLQSRATAAENQVAVGETALSEATDRVNAAESKLEGLEWKLTMAEAKVSETETALAAATSKATTLETDIAKARAAAEESSTKLRSEVTAHNDAATKLSAAEAKLATTITKLSATEAKVGTLQAMAAELDLALQRERGRVAEIEAGHRRVQAAAVSSAREVLSRLERHETKLAGLRKDALARAISLLEEAGGVHASDIAVQAGRLTPSVPSSRPIVAVSGPARTVGALSKEAKPTSDASSRDTAPPPVPRPSKSGETELARVGSRPDAAVPAMPTQSEAVSTTSEPAPTPVRGTSRQTGRNKRTQQGLAALPRGAFAGERSTKKSTIPPKVDEADVVEITVDDE